jgi:hypothetical protein
MKTITEIIGGAQGLLNISYNLQDVFEEYLSDEYKTFLHMLRVLEDARNPLVRGYAGTGRIPYQYQPFVRSVPAKCFFKIDTTTQYRLQTDSNLRLLCGFEKIPGKSTFSRNFTALSGTSLMSGTPDRLAKEAHAGQVVYHASRDSTAIEAREKAHKKAGKEGKKEKKRRGRPRKGEVRPPKPETVIGRQVRERAEDSLKKIDTARARGCKKNSRGVTRFWTGYKLHLDVSDTGFPLSAFVSGANVHDSQLAIPLENAKGNKYAPIIRGELADLSPDESDYYDEEAFDIDILDQWAEKAEQYLADKKPQEAVLIAQAYIEEFAYWLTETIDDDFVYWIPETYQSRPFEILEKAAVCPQVNARDIYDYCIKEMSRKRYSGLYMADHFNDLLMKLSVTINPEAFVELQQRLLKKVSDKSSYDAKKILTRIVDFYNSRRQPAKAWKCMEDNIQIESFRRRLVEKQIKQKEFSGAKKLIHEYTGKKKNKNYSAVWDEYLLQIAQAEHDIPVLRDISWSFIKNSFKKRYYQIYKAAFTRKEWPEKFIKAKGIPKKYGETEHAACSKTKRFNFKGKGKGAAERAGNPNRDKGSFCS